MKLAIVESDTSLADLLAYAAQRRGHQAVCVPDISRLFERLPFEPSVIVAEVGSHTAVDANAIAAIRRQFERAALFVTMERPREPGPTTLLRAGAHQVVRTPYNPNEVVIQAENWLASQQGEAAVTDTLVFGDLELALDRYTATKNGKNVVFTKLELRLLYCLVEHSPHLAPLERLLVFGWDSLGDPEPSLLKTHISHIRKKLAEAGGQPFAITSRQTLGYVLQASSR